MRLGPALAVIALVICACRPLPGAVSGKADGHVIWSEDKPWFGGFSALVVTEGGAGFIAVSDAGRLVTGRLQRRDGHLSGVILTGMRRLRDADGAPLKHPENDAEGIAVGADGTLYISFEQKHRVRAYAAPDGPARDIPTPAAFGAFGDNSSLEALAIDARGRLYTMPERPPSPRTGFLVYRLADGRWTVPFRLPKRDGFLAVSGEFGPDGRFYLLERRLTLLGFQSRLRRWDVSDDRPRDESTVLVTPAGAYDNLEGMSLWRDASGVLRVTLISDDNFRSFQRTELVEFVLAE